MGIITGLIKGVGGFLERRRESKDKREEREFDLIKAGYKSNEEGWKDEYITGIITAPFVLLVIFCLFAWDEGIVRIQRSFEVIDTLPVWYQELFTYTVLAGLGMIGVVKPTAKYFERRNNKKNDK